MKTKQLPLIALVIAMLILSACSGLPSLSLSAGAASPANQGQINPVTSAGASQQQAIATTVPVSSSAAPSASAGAVAAFEGVLENVYAQVNPSVVNVEVSTSVSAAQNTPFGFGGSTPSQEGLGSGFVWDTQGHIVTNNHVIDGADQIRVTFADGTTVDASLVGADPNSDLAVIKVGVPAAQLHPVVVADSTQVKVGELAIAIGNPYGLSGTMTSGIISALSRTLPVGLDNATGLNGPTYSIPDIIQTDASINPGNSGGVLVNDQGQLIGVTAAIQSTSGANSGIGFVIPSNLVQKVVPVLIEKGQYEHSWMGISGISLNADLVKAAKLSAGQQGVLVIDVTAGSPAEKAGLRGGTQEITVSGQQIALGGDVITAIDGQPVQRFEDLVSYLYNQTEVGQTVSLTVLRQGHEQTVQLKLGALPTTGS